MHEGSAQPSLTIVVPSYNSQDFLHRCLDSLIAAGAGIEVLIVNDGSTDGTAAIAEDFVRRHPATIRAISQDNAGHGGAINTGLAEARGEYVKVVDSDDWVDPKALARLVRELDRMSELGVDMVLSNFVYEKQGRSRRRAVRYRRALPSGRVFGWSEVAKLPKTQYFLMHSIVYRTQLLRDIDLRLPEHTFYVDNIFAFVPLSHVERMYYLDVDLYRYFIGREDQSVAEHVMLRRLDQQLRVNRVMLTHIAHEVPPVHPAYRYMAHYLEIVSAVSSALLLRAGTPQSLAAKDAWWQEIRDTDELLYRRMRRGALGQLLNLPGQPGRRITMAAYRAAQWAVGFN
ncbi:MAG: glycosyltransferase family 2 protein [Beutenbergiaceae bacterium]